MENYVKCESFKLESKKTAMLRTSKFVESILMIHIANNKYHYIYDNQKPPFATLQPILLIDPLQLAMKTKKAALVPYINACSTKSGVMINDLPIAMKIVLLIMEKKFKINFRQIPGAFLYPTNIIVLYLMTVNINICILYIMHIQSLSLFGK